MDPNTQVYEDYIHEKKENREITTSKLVNENDIN